MVGGRYRIGKLIGAGGMADVYEACHVLTEHAVALKLLRPAKSSAFNRTHLALEARIDARVNSPYIVHMRDAGFDDRTGSAYLVMELLRGTTLERLVKGRSEGRLPVGEALEVVRQVALGLDAAHSFAVVHRDLKPENVFVTTDSTVKLLDFGIAKILDASNDVTRELRGTPYYMAPEQATGAAVSAQTDIWALGLVVYRVLTGRLYWRCAHAAGERAPTLAEAVYEITVSVQDPPSARLAQQGVRVQLPPGFDAWFLRCIARTPSERFDSATSAFRALESVFRDVSVGMLPMLLPLGPVGDGAAPTQATRTCDDEADSGPALKGTVARGTGRRSLGPHGKRVLAALCLVLGMAATHGSGGDPARPRDELDAREALVVPRAAAPVPSAPRAFAEPPRVAEPLPIRSAASRVAPRKRVVEKTARLDAIRVAATSLAPWPGESLQTDNIDPWKP
jgi:eukaryotic-like serine/threonine-protein kinase